MAKRITMAFDSTIDLRPDDLREYDQGQYAAEASTLGLKPGEWPSYIAVAGLCGKPETLWFDQFEEHRNHGELISWSYVNKLTGMLVTIYND